MRDVLHLLRANDRARYLVVPRLIAAVPLIAIGIGHLFDRAPLVAMLEAASIPMPEVNAFLAPAVEIAAGILLLLGLFARLGAIMAASTMVVALYTHMVIDPTHLPDGVMMPPLALPIAVLLSAAVIAWRGAGAFSLDAGQAGT